MASSSHVFSKSNGLQPNSGIYFLLNVCIIPIKKDHSFIIDTIYDRPLWCQMIHVADSIWRDKAWLLLLCNPLPHLSSCGSPWIDIVNRWVYLEKDEQLRSICKMVTNSIDVIFFWVKTMMSSSSLFLALHWAYDDGVACGRRGNVKGKRGKWGAREEGRTLLASSYVTQQQHWSRNPWGSIGGIVIKQTLRSVAQPLWFPLRRQIRRIKEG